MEVDQQTEEKKEPTITGPQDVKTKQDIVELLDKDLKMLDQFFKNFVWYNQVIQEAVENQLTKKSDADLKALADTPLHDLYSHKDQVTERMEFLKTYMSKSPNKLSMNFLDKLWYTLIDKSKLPMDH